MTPVLRRMRNGPKQHLTLPDHIGPEFHIVIGVEGNSEEVDASVGTGEGGSGGVVGVAEITEDAVEADAVVHGVGAARGGEGGEAECGGI